MRRRRAESHEFAPDARYGSELVTHLVNIIMSRGKKSTAQRTVYGALEQVKEQTEGKDPIEVYKQALENIKPKVEVKSRRVGGATYQVPIEIRAERRQTLGLRWLVSYARKRGERTISARLAGEIMDGANSQGNAFKKKEDTHKMAEANKAFAHYRW